MIFSLLLLALIGAAALWLVLEPLRRAAPASPSAVSTPNARCVACGNSVSNARSHRSKSSGSGGRGTNKKLPHQNVGLFGERITVRSAARVMAAPSWRRRARSVW